MTAPVTFTVALAALGTGHQAGDYWVQTHGQAQRKGLPGWPGRAACAAHVATYTFTQAWCLILVSVVLSVRFGAWHVAAGLAVSAVTHYAADRREPLRRLAAAIGKAGYWESGGQPALDQAWHWTWLFAAALVIAGGWTS